MTEPARKELRYTAKQYFELVDQGVLDPEDRVELLEGVIVSMSPQTPRHAAAITRLTHILHELIGKRAVVRVQTPLVAGRRSVPEPDIAVIAGSIDDFDFAHPTNALLVVEVADSSLKQDRITKGAIYAVAGVAEYWIVNLRDDCIEVSRALDPKRGRYRRTSVARRGDAITLAAVPGARVAVSDLLPRRPR